MEYFLHTGGSYGFLLYKSDNHGGYLFYVPKRREWYNFISISNFSIGYSSATPKNLKPITKEEAEAYILLQELHR